MPSVVDPAVLSFVERISAGSAGLAESVASLLLRLAFRVSKLELATEQQAKKLQQLAKQKPAPGVPLVPIMTGVDVATGSAIRIMPKRSRGRPAGSRDTYKRSSRARHHNLEAEVSSNLIDGDWDHLGVD
jgi:hypothetical protein